jgi:maltose alpha-D-glucosyltransferase/alpha-amylase
MATHTLTVESEWKELFPKGKASEPFEAILPDFLHQMRWFGAKTGNIKSYEVGQALTYTMQSGRLAYILFVEIIFQTSNTESYLLPVVLNKTLEQGAQAICEVKSTEGGSLGFLVDALHDVEFRNDLFFNMLIEKNLELSTGEFRFSRGKVLDGLSADVKEIKSTLLKLEQSNSTIVYNDDFYLKIYRKIFRDNNPDLELTHFLSDKGGFKNSPKFAGAIEWVREGYYKVSIGLMQQRVENQGEAWNYTLGQMEGFFKRFAESGLKLEDFPKVHLYKPLKRSELSAQIEEIVGKDFLNKIEKLAVRTAEMHISLFSDKTDRYFTPEPFRGDYTVWLLNRLMYMLDGRFHLLEQKVDQLTGLAKEYAEYVLENKEEIKNHILKFDELRLTSSRIRIHGDYHLGQVLITEDDFCILDFEGEPESTIRDRKVKQPPIKDLAGLCRSFHYAVFATVFNAQHGILSRETSTELGGRLYRLITGLTLENYVKTAMDNGLNIGYAKEIDFLLRYHIFEKAIYEIGYELNSRPDWVIIPLKGIIQILNND